MMGANGLEVAGRCAWCWWGLALCVLGSQAAGAQDRAGGLEGAWRPETYIMKDGVERRVDGLIVFSKSEWLTLFFVQSGQDVERGASEGGSYTLSGDKLTLRHRLHLSAGKALPNVPETAPLKMELRKPEDATVEPCRIELRGDRLTLFFPSGNTMRFVRAGQ